MERQTGSSQGIVRPVTAMADRFGRRGAGRERFVDASSPGASKRSRQDPQGDVRLCREPEDLVDHLRLRHRGDHVELQKIQFTSSGQVQLSRPDKLRATRTGGYRDIEIVFDGKMLTVNNKDANDFAQIDAPGSIDQ